MEPHDRCEVPGCTLGRAHVGEHVGPRCPTCYNLGRWVYAGAAGGVSAWYCRGGRCGYGDPIPVPAEPHDRCDLDGCTLGRAHVGEHVGPSCPKCGKTWVWFDIARAWARGCAHNLPMPAGPARQEMPAASPLAVEPTTTVDQLFLDIEAEAREEDEKARSAQRRAVELRAMLAYLRAKLAKITLASTGASNTGRGSNP